MPDQRTRRQAVALLGAGVSAGLAGCFSVTQSESTGASDDPTPTQTAESPQPTSVPPAVDSHLAPADNYDGSVVDARGQDTVTVTVATQANGGAFGFGPPAVHVDNGTTVQWEWTGEGGGHNVESADDGPLDSGAAVEEPGVNYEFTFEDDGIYNYVCVPHESLGMKGSVLVGDDYTTTDESATPDQY